jgi:hypothetical protein
MKKGNIEVKNITVDGKHQAKWFKIFDLLDEIYSDEEKENITITYTSCKITGFNFIEKELPKGTTKRNFADFVKDASKNKILEFDRRTGKITWFLNKKYKSIKK